MQGESMEKVLSYTLIVSELIVSLVPEVVS